MIDPAICHALKRDDLVFHAAGSSFSKTGSLTSGHDKYFLKIGGCEMITGEAESYRHIHDAVPGFCPIVIAEGQTRDGYFLVTSYLNFSRGDLVNSLVRLHAKSNDDGQFGFPVKTCCADTVQDNTWNYSWKDFFIEQRLKPISKLATNQDDQELQQLVAEACESAIPHLLTLNIVPSLIHGDLWSGNERGGQVFDSCALYAHSEFELSIMSMFGGFSQVISEYHKLKPKDEPASEYEDRQALYTCYHQLNHSGTGQGSSYKAAAKSSLKKLIAKYHAGASFSSCQ